MESAIRSRDWSEKLMPSVPIDIPSLTPIVLKRMPSRPAASTPCFTFAARSRRCILQVLPSYHMLAMPTCALSISASVIPVPYNIAWDAPCDFTCVIRELYLFSAMVFLSIMSPQSPIGLGSGSFPFFIRPIVI